MAFKLRITFTGLCLFVPDRSRTRMHVLMPDTTGHPGMLHLARLHYNGANAGGPAGPVVPVPLEGLALDFVGLAGNVHALPPEIANLTTILGARADPSIRSGVISSVTLRAGKVTHRQGLGKWVFPGDPQRRRPRHEVHMANWAVWTARVDAAEVGLVTTPRGIGPRGGLLTLKPVQGSDLVCITVSHLYIHEEELEREPGYVPEHFHCYFPCLQGGDLREPELLEKGWTPLTAVEGEEGDSRCVPDDKARRVLALGIAYSCMIAGADPV
ncbi:MAG TPA: hypothetical protein VF263_13140 [Longimicrobiaceae bacterium]